MISRIHSHPKYEKQLDIGEEHVIIDRELYNEMLLLNTTLKIISIRHFNREARTKSPK